MTHEGCRRASQAMPPDGAADQFCIYVADRLVLPSLTAEQIADIGYGRLQLDALVRGYIRDRLAYRFISAEDGKQAYEVENAIKRGRLANVRYSIRPKCGGVVVQLRCSNARLPSSRSS